jgi:ABC-type transporter Mla MlaB component
MGWVFSGPSEFAALAAPFLAEGAALGERLMYVPGELDPADLAGLMSVVGPDALQMTSIAEVYGQTGIVDPRGQRATFEAALADALAAGYTGLRVAADNTSLVTDDERLAAWIRWEVMGDRFLSDSQVTGLCGFDQQKVDVSRLRHLATLHPLSSASSPVPQFRLFSDAGTLRIEGQVDSFAVTQLWQALENLPPKTGILVDLESATLMSRGVMAGISQLCDSGTDVTIRGAREAIDELRPSFSPLADRLVLQVS